MYQVWCLSINGNWFLKILIGQHSIYQYMSRAVWLLTCNLWPHNLKSIRFIYSLKGTCVPNYGLSSKGFFISYMDNTWYTGQIYQPTSAKQQANFSKCIWSQIVFYMFFQISFFFNRKTDWTSSYFQKTKKLLTNTLKHFWINEHNKWFHKIV